MPIRTRLGEMMRARQMTRMDVVRRAEISYPTVKKWEEDALTDLDTAVLQKLLDTFGVTYEQFIYMVDEEPAQPARRRKGEK